MIRTLIALLALGAAYAQQANLPQQAIGANDLIAVSVYNAPELDKSDWEPTTVGADAALWLLRQAADFTGQVVGITELRARGELGR